MICINGNASGIKDDLSENLSAHIPVKLLKKYSVGPSNISVLKSSAVSGSFSNFAVALSDHRVLIYDSHGNLSNEYEHNKTVTCIKFSTKEPSILFTSSLEGKIHVWDTRCQDYVQTFYDDSDGTLKPILCFDYNQNEQIICAGTELIREDVFHLFWDRRSSEILGGYWNSHAADITQIHFHPFNKSWMASSSVDGLINVFDLNKESEDDALMQSINVEAPINTFTWKLQSVSEDSYSWRSGEDILSCTTSNEEYHLMGMESMQSVYSTSRKKLHEDFKVNVDYMVDSFQMHPNFFLATGNNSGTMHLWNIYRNSLNYGDYKPVGYSLKGHTDVVRTVSYDDKSCILLTGGDDGCICLWELKPVDIPCDSENLSFLSNGW